MKNVTRHTGTLRVIERLPNSVNGNPRYIVRIDGWTCRTTPDSSHGYRVTNYEGRRVVATIGTYYGRSALNSIALAEDK